MRAIILERAGSELRLVERPAPEPGAGEIRVRVRACGVCRTDLHVLDGELPDPKLPLVLGHQVVGEVESVGPGPARFAVGARVGIPWLGWACGVCRFCTTGRENLCEKALFTGYTKDGGFAEATVADARFAVGIPDRYGDVAAAPLLCAGLIGYRTLRMAGEAERVGIFGFGAAAHLVAQVARHQGRRVFAFTRPGDAEAARFALSLGAAWAGGWDEAPPEPLDAALIFAPVGALVPAALRAVERGGTVVCGGIHMSDIPSFPYELLWGERSVRSVANLTRADAEDFMRVAAETQLETHTTAFPLARAADALEALREGAFVGAAVLVPEAACG